MANIWEERIGRVVNKLLRTQYPHLQKPTAVRGQITKVTSNQYHIVILDENLKRDTNYPEIPNVSSQLTLKNGDMVVVIFLNGNDAYIVGVM